MAFSVCSAPLELVAVEPPATAAPANCLPQAEILCRAAPVRQGVARPALVNLHKAALATMVVLEGGAVVGCLTLAILASCASSTSRSAGRSSGCYPWHYWGSSRWPGNGARVYG